jgi:hypothetical protein
MDYVTDVDCSENSAIVLLRDNLILELVEAIRHNDIELFKFLSEVSDGTLEISIKAREKERDFVLAETVKCLKRINGVWVLVNC